MTTITEQAETVPASPNAHPKATQTKASRGARRAHAALSKAKAGRKARSRNNSPKRARQAGARDGSKKAIAIEILRRKNGATMKQLMKATGWQPHSVRGFLSGTVGKKMGLTVVSVKGEDGGRVYSIGTRKAS
jgi:hypothetical protein